MSQITVYYDYTCPYVYRATEWVYTLQEDLNETLDVTWRFFSLTQVNYRQPDDWKVWNEPRANESWQDQDYARALRLFWAAEAGRRQGEAAFNAIHRSLLRTIHADKQKLDLFASVQEVAAEAGLDMKKFMQDMEDLSCLERLDRDHTAGAQIQVFGTPTFVFPDAQPAYLKLTKPLYGKEAAAFWQSFKSVVADQPFVIEIKRPQ